ncbi:hypothetical protein SKAU_G00383020 [Synaphobranchus kaupii]|uniref:Uncharacterized protein n=1 Tax=Synaphobranchus kaupii TaxID=118154 RepID=A0A9Q1IEU8_SYNKA|nr:hypothetical protein SKAU_G00383020 [Synaphobranchus kaupii]
MRLSPLGSRPSSRSLVFGLGASITNVDGIITGAKLPSGRQILRCMLYNCDAQLHAKRPGLNGALSWGSCGRIPQARRSSEATARQVDPMECRLDATFPLWSPNAEELIRDPEDVAFLASMKGDRVATFGAFDAKLQSKVKRLTGA